MVYKFTEPTKWIKLSVAKGLPLVQAKNKIFTCVWVSGGWQQWWHPGPDHSLTRRSDCRDIAGHTEGWDMKDLSRGTRYPAHYFSSSLNDQNIRYDSEYTKCKIMVASSTSFMYLIDADTHLPLFNLLHNLLFEGVTGFGNGPVDDTGSVPWVPG